MLKYSKQREAILLFLSDRKDHPTAETVYSGIKKDFPNISLGTVYRNLNLLAEIQEIQKIPGNSGPDHFDPNTKMHPHFFCTQCQSVLDLDLEDTNLIPLVQENFQGTISGQVTYFFGLCPKCTQ